MAVTRSARPGRVPWPSFVEEEVVAEGEWDEIVTWWWRSAPWWRRTLVAGTALACLAAFVWWVTTPVIHLPGFATPPEGAR
jgi:hypothetical protein